MPKLRGSRLEHAKHHAARSSVLCLLSSVLETRNQKLSNSQTFKPSHTHTLALSPCLGRMEMLRFTWNFLCPFGFIVVEGDTRPVTQKSRPGHGSRNSERKAKGNMSRENATEEKTSDFRRRTSIRSGARRLRWPYGARVVASRGLELEVTIRGSGTLAASALARHCEATGVSLHRKGRVHESVRGLSPASF